ncbi:hypothetical protein [Aeromicrobium chenweiae]|uniref:Uncharacterized protein n=1 Tax=Aeromicrobium chenweiae TaxID=2079793 RepID=A0A2S0WLI2_9ACTN|nr:hypothetical protein [Aeromicrobium chenweiae]AWB92171.1 hypothetical protein C3E78_08145 [Aeromicrobium chenweiae]TGN33025.1 hypothetical protein E4L97_10140 [Aeromicrobium chenweiae]
MTAPADTRARIEAWFDDHGLPYFTGDHADTVEGWLSSKRIVAALVLIIAVSIAAGVAVGAVWAEQGSVGTFVGVVVFLALLGLFAGRLLRMGTMLRWAARRTFGSLGLMFPLLTRALPLLLLAVTFLFINAEVWQVAALMSRHVLWLAVLFFAAIAVVFLLARLPEEVRQVERDVVGPRVAERCVGTPAEDAARSVTTEPADLPRFARANLVLVLLFNQAIQVLLLTLGLFAFFVVFGSLTIPDGTVEAWTGEGVTTLPSSLGQHIPLTNELFQVAVFLAAFSGLYFTVYAVTDETYRSQFFAGLSAELEQAVAVNAVYVSLPHEMSPH